MRMTAKASRTCVPQLRTITDKELMEMRFPPKDRCVEDWYVRTFPDDRAGRKVNPNVTFGQALAAVPSGTGLCNLLGIDDTVVLTRILVELSRLTNIPFSALHGAFVRRQPIGFRPEWREDR